MNCLAPDELGKSGGCHLRDDEAAASSPSYSTASTDPFIPPNFGNRKKKRPPRRDRSRSRSLFRQLCMDEEAPAKRRRWEHRCGISDATAPSFHMEDLPEEILPLVLSLLSLKEAARTSIVSRNWTKFWTQYPNLCFDGTKGQPSDEDTVKIERAKFIETINSIIQQHSGLGLNKFSIKCGLHKKSSYHLDRWIGFASASKAKIIDFKLWSKRYCGRPIKKVYHFPLEALGVQDGPFIQALLLSDVPIKPHLDICGFTKLRRLRLHCVQIMGDLPGLLLNCSSLEELEFIACSGVSDLNIPHPLDKLRHLVISHMHVQMVYFHVSGLVYFKYNGALIPVELHGCSNLEKATVKLEGDNKTLGNAFDAISSISAVKVLNIHADIKEYKNPVWVSQVHMLTMRPTCMFRNLRYLTCELIIFTGRPNCHSGLLQLVRYLEFSPQLEVLQLHMFYYTLEDTCWSGEVTGEELSCMRPPSSPQNCLHEWVSVVPGSGRAAMRHSGKEYCA